MAQKGRAHALAEDLSFPAPMLSSSQSSVTQAFGDLTPSSGLPEKLHSYTHNYMQIRIHTPSSFLSSSFSSPSSTSSSSYSQFNLR